MNASTCARWGLIIAAVHSSTGPGRSQDFNPPVQGTLATRVVVTHSMPNKAAPTTARVHRVELSQSNAFILEPRDRSAIIIVDAGMRPPYRDAWRIAGTLKGLGYSAQDLASRPVVLVLTHVHPDHAGGAGKLRELLGGNLVVVVGAEDADDLRHGKGPVGTVRGSLGVMAPLLQLLADLGVPALEPDHVVQDGNAIVVGTVVLRVMALPGHTHGSMGYAAAIREGDAGSPKTVMFVGDLVVSQDGPHAQRTYAESWSTLANSLEKLKAASAGDVDTLFYGGHGVEPITVQQLQPLRVTPGP